MNARLPADQRRRQLLGVARTIFAERGFHLTSMDDVADAAGVTKPVLYQHFRSKRALFGELLSDIGNQLVLEWSTATLAATSPRDTVQRGFTAYFRFLDADPAAFRLLFGATVRHDPEFGDICEEIIERIAAEVVGLIEIDGPAEQRAALAHALVGMAESVGRWVLTDPTIETGLPSSEKLAEWLMELSWFGLRGLRIPTLAPSAAPDTPGSSTLSTNAASA